MVSERGVKPGSTADTLLIRSLILSDGDHFVQAMLTTTLNDLVTGDEPAISKFTIVKLPTYAVNVVQNRRCVLLLFSFLFLPHFSFSCFQRD